MTTLLSIATIIIFIAMLIYFFMSYYYYYRSYDNISPFPSIESFKRFWYMLKVNVSLLTPRSFKMLTISYTLMLIFAGLLCFLLLKY